MGKKLICQSIAVLLISSSLFSKTICYEPSDGISKFHLIWQGETASDKVRKNVEILCNQVKDYIRTVDEKFTITVWTDDNSKQFFSDVKECASPLTIGDSVGSLSYEVRHVNELTSGEPDAQKSLYNFYLEKNSFAAASDFTRLLAVKNNGGCYMDMGFRVALPDFVSKELQNTYGDNVNYFTAVGGGHFREEPTRTYSREHHQKVWSLYADVKTAAGINSGNSVAFEPYMKMFNGFIAATKNNPIIQALYDEFTFKNKFFSTYRALVEGIFDNCSSHPVVMSLIGQFAYNDLYLSLVDRNDDLLARMKVLDLNNHIPYAGSNTWRSDNRKSCGMFVASLYERYQDKRLADHSEVARNGIGFVLGKPEYDEATIARNILMPLVRLFRREPNSPILALSSITTEEMAALTKGIRNSRSVTGNDIVNMCAASTDSIGADDAKKYQSKNSGSRAIAIIEKAGIVAEKSLSVNLSYYVDNEAFDVTAPDDLYFGFLVICEEKVKDIFVPQVKIRPSLMQMLASIPKPITTLESAYRRLSQKEIEGLKQGYLYLVGIYITESELLLLMKAHTVNDLSVAGSSEITDATIAQLIDLQELSIIDAPKIKAAGIFALLEAQDKHGKPRLKSLELRRGQFSDDNVKKLVEDGLKIRVW